MNLLRWSRAGLVLSIAIYLLGLAALALSASQGVRGLAFWLCVLSMAGMAIASILALASQVALLVRRRVGGRARHG